MARARKGPLAVALIGLLLFGGAAVSAQSTRTDTKKKPAAAKSEAVAKPRARKQAPSAQEPVPLPQAAPGTRFQQQLPLMPPGGRQSTGTADAPSAPMVGPPAPEAQRAQPESTPATQSTPPPVTSAPVERTLNMVRTAPEQIGQVPSQFMWIRDGLMAARDTFDNTLAFFSDDGHVLGRAKFPNGFDTEDIVGQPDAIRLIDFSHRLQITIPRSVDPAGTTTLQSTPNGSDAAARARRLTRRGPQELVVNDERQSGTHPLTIRAVAGGRLAQAYEISPGTNDNRYVVTEEITAVKPALTVRVVVQRFDRAGKLTGVAYVPLDTFAQVSRNFIAVTGAGLARVLRPTIEGVKIDEYDFVAPPRGGRRLSDGELRSLSRKLREAPVDTTVQGDNSTPFNENPQQLQLEVPAPPIARDAVLAGARAYLTVNWVMQRENFSRPGIDNRCDPGSSYVWLRPRRFSEDMIGTTIGPMPYRWGGEDTPASFRIRTEWGALAGNLCTCRQAEYNYCLFADSAGVDCSGFVSRAWGIEKRGTSGLLDVATELDSVDALKPGDAFDWPQRHIRLFMGLAPGAAIAFTVLEASTRYQCEGVCERVYRPSEMNGYKLIRYKGIRDTAVATNGGAKPNGAPAPATTGAAVPVQDGGTATVAKPNGAAIVATPSNGGAATPAGKRVTRSATNQNKRTRQR